MRHSGNPIPVSDFSWKRCLSLCIVIQYNPVFDRMKILISRFIANCLTDGRPNYYTFRQGVSDIGNVCIITMTWRIMNTLLSVSQWSFRGRTCVNAVPVVEKLPERMGTVFPLLKCLRTHYGRHCEPFSDQKCTIYCMTLNIQSQTQTPISARLASVPIAPGLRSDHCCELAEFEVARMYVRPCP